MKSTDTTILTLGKFSPEPQWAEVEMARFAAAHSAAAPAGLALADNLGTW